MQHQVVALELERGRHEGVFYGPGLQRQVHGAWHGVAGEAGGVLFDARQHGALHAGVVQAGGLLRVQAQVGGKALPFVVLDHRHAGNEGPVFAHYKRLLQRRVGQHGQFQITRRHLFAGGGDDDFLDAAPDVDAPVDDFCLVARAQPAVGAQDFGGVFGTIPVALHHDRAAHLQLTVVANAHLYTGQGAAHAGGVVVVGGIGRHHGCGFGHAVALHQLQAQPQEAFGDGGRQRGATAHGHTHAAAKLRQQWLGHQRLQQGPGQGGHPASGLVVVGLGRWQALGGTKARPAFVLRRFVQLHLPGRGRELFEQLGVNAFVNAGHGHQHGGAHRFQVFGQQRHRACIGHAAARSNRQVIATRALKRVRQRQERQEHVVHRGCDALKHRLHVADHVAVREHHALGLAGGARGVDEGGQVLGAGWRGGRQLSGAGRAGQPLRQRANGRAVGSGGTGVDLAIVVHDDHRAQCRKRRAYGPDVLPVLGLAHDEHGGFAVGQDVGNAAWVVDGVQGHRHAACGQRGLVCTHGVQAVGQQDGHAGGSGQLRGNHGLRPLRHTLCGLLPGQVDPVMRGGIKSTVGLCVGGVGNTVGEELGQRFDAGEVGGKRGHREVC